MPDRTEEMRWLAENREKYAGQWMALDGQRLIANGKDAKAVFAAAKASGVRPFVVHLEDAGQVAFGGW